VPEDPDPEDVFALLADECARTLLAVTSREPMSAPELVEACDASRATVYRRIAELNDADLLTERGEYDPDGNHRSVYTARLRGLHVGLEDGEFTLSVEEDPADRLSEFWEGL